MSSKATKPYSLNDAVFRRSGRSGNSGNCVEVATNFANTHGIILLRDSKNPGQPAHEFTVAEWTAFLGGVQDGEFQP